MQAEVDRAAAVSTDGRGHGAAAVQFHRETVDIAFRQTAVGERACIRLGLGCAVVGLFFQRAGLGFACGRTAVSAERIAVVAGLRTVGDRIATPGQQTGRATGIRFRVGVGRTVVALFVRVQDTIPAARGHPGSGTRVRGLVGGGLRLAREEEDGEGGDGSHGGGYRPRAWAAVSMAEWRPRPAPPRGSLLHACAAALDRHRRPHRMVLPGTGPERAWIAEDGTLVTHPEARGGPLVRPVGTVLARATDPAALAHVPGVAAVVPLRGDGGTVRIEPRADADPFVLSRTLHARPDVRWAHPDLVLPLVLHDLPDDTYLDSQWHLDNPGSEDSAAGVDVRAVDAWEITNGEGGLVAIIDSGVDTEHPDLRVTNGYDYADRDDDSNPTDNAHGTAAAGLAAAIGDNGLGVTGVAWGADVYGIRLLGGETSVEDVRDAFIEATDAGAWVINNSWGFGQDCPNIPRISAIEDGLEYAEEEAATGLAR